MCRLPHIQLEELHKYVCLANSHHQAYKNITLETSLVSPPFISLSLLRFQIGWTSFTLKIYIK